MSQNPRHSSKNDRWITPPDIVARGYEVLGGPPDLDPASSEDDNVFVQARRIITREEDGLTAPWNCAGKSIWMNPPGGLRDGAGGRTRDASLTGLFWRRLAAHREEISHAIVIGFNIEILALSQRYSDFPASQLPLVIPRRRTKFWKYDKVGNLVEGKSPSHANVFIYVPGTIDCTDVFERSFSDLGAVTIPR